MDKFSRSLNGYNIKEVNAFLNDTITNMESILAKAKNQEQKISDQSKLIGAQNQKLDEQNQYIQKLTEQLEHYRSLESTLQKAIYSLEDERNNIRKSAYQERDLLIEEAKQNASRIVNDALIRSEKIELKTETAERNLRIFKSRLRSIIEQQQAVVDEIEVLELED